jgi:hypothetical protein
MTAVAGQSAADGCGCRDCGAPICRAVCQSSDCANCCRCCVYFDLRVGRGESAVDNDVDKRSMVGGELQPLNSFLEADDNSDWLPGTGRAVRRRFGGSQWSNDNGRGSTRQHGFQQLTGFSDDGSDVSSSDGGISEHPSARTSTKSLIIRQQALPGGWSLDRFLSSGSSLAAGGCRWSKSSAMCPVTFVSKRR